MVPPAAFAPQQQQQHLREGAKPSSSRYESQKRRDWNTFGQYLKNHRPPIVMARCAAQHVVEFLRYLDQFGKTKVHIEGCQFFGCTGEKPCTCPMRQAWGSLDSLVGRLRAAYEENGGKSELNPFGARLVRLYLREIREGQAKARGITYEKKKRKRSSNGHAAPVAISMAAAGQAMRVAAPGQQPGGMAVVKAETGLAVPPLRPMEVGMLPHLNQPPPRLSFQGTQLMGSGNGGDGSLGLYCSGLAGQDSLQDSLQHSGVASSGGGMQDGGGSGDLFSSCSGSFGSNGSGGASGGSYGNNLHELQLRPQGGVVDALRGEGVSLGIGLDDGAYNGHHHHGLHGGHLSLGGYGSGSNRGYGVANDHISLGLGHLGGGPGSGVGMPSLGLAPRGGLAQGLGLVGDVLGVGSTPDHQHHQQLSMMLQRSPEVQLHGGDSGSGHVGSLLAASADMHNPATFHGSFHLH
eukprot:SM000001S04405  [mRNA]  locus=s1:61947:63604:+ [translate_table: standard]